MLYRLTYQIAGIQYSEQDASYERLAARMQHLIAEKQIKDPKIVEIGQYNRRYTCLLKQLSNGQVKPGIP